MVYHFKTSPPQRFVERVREFLDSADIIGCTFLVSDDSKFLSDTNPFTSDAGILQKMLVRSYLKLEILIRCQKSAKDGRPLASDDHPRAKDAGIVHLKVVISYLMLN